jgi:acetylornithine deacetylase
MSDPTIEFLCELVSIESVNPSLVPDGAGEAAIARRIAREMEAIGLETTLQEVDPGRPNAIGVLDSGRPGPALMFCGHIDTVGVAGMTAPFDPAIRGDRLYGRGSQDMKGGVAAMIGAARRVREAGGVAAGRLIVAAVADEEHASRGAEALVAAWRADAAVVTEPTDLGIGVAHKGFAWVRVVTEGRAAHGSRPAEGRDAIFRMGRVLTRLEALDRALQHRPPHPYVGPPSLHASLVSGGRELSTYPDHCDLQIERRTVPGEDEGCALDEIERILDDLRHADAEFAATAALMFGRSAYETPRDHAIIDRLAEAGRMAGIEPRPVGIAFWADSAVLGEAGIPTVLFGPGGAGLHGLEEFVKVSEVLACQETLACLARSFCV